MRKSSESDHMKLFSNTYKLNDLIKTVQYLKKEGIYYIPQKLSWSENNEELQRFAIYKDINAKLKKNLEFFVYIKFININSNSYAIVCGKTTVGKYGGKVKKPLGDLKFTTDETKGLSKKVIKKYNYEWNKNTIIIIPTDSNYDSIRLEGKIVYDLALMTT